MKVGVWPSDATGCGYYRLRWPAAALQQSGHDVDIREDWVGMYATVEDAEPRLVGVRAPDCDVAVFQRVYRHELLEFMMLLQAEGIALVVDIDDDLAALNPRHAMYRELMEREAAFVLKEAVRIADLVTVSTPALAKRYGGAKARVIPNGVPRGYLGIGRVREARDVPVIGWTGSVKTHVDDLFEVGSSVADLCRDGKARFRAIGDPATLDVLGIPFAAREHQKGATLHTFDYARAYAALDVAVVPLRPSRFNAGKSWLKMAEAASLGVPTVASPTPENVRLNEMGVGFLAERSKDWKTHLARLCGSPDLRLAMGATGKAVMSTMTIEQWVAPQLWEAWQSALKNRVRKAA